MKQVKIITDGACSGNPGPGGFAAVLRFGAHVREIVGGETDTTNNRMELRAVIEGLKALKEPCAVVIVSDSKYVVDGATQWMPDWIRRGWRTAAKKEVANSDLWQEINDLMQTHSVKFEWVKGHAHHADNIRADRLAVAIRDAKAEEAEGEFYLEMDEFHMELFHRMQEWRITKGEKVGKEIDQILKECKDPGCELCGQAICKYGEPLHFHHDGCPACYTDSDV